MEYDRLKEILTDNRGKLAGIAMGLVFGWFAIVYGVFKAVFVCVCIVAGYYIGLQVDKKTGLYDIFRGRTKDR